MRRRASQQPLTANRFLRRSSDNGGPTNGNEGTMSNNFPMRGGKNTLWEGGTRVVRAPVPAWYCVYVILSVAGRPLRVSWRTALSPDA